VDVAGWLRSLGFGQYAGAFRDNHIDGQVLPQLTADDLIAIGVTSVGHRRTLLSAIAARTAASASSRERRRVSAGRLSRRGRWKPSAVSSP